MIDKIPQYAYSLMGAVVIFLVFPKHPQAQVLERSSYGVSYIKDPAQYALTVARDPAKELIELHSIMPQLVYDLRYAGPANFTHAPLYPPGTNYSFLRQPAAVALQKVQAELNKQGYGLKIFDSYRPYEVTIRFWEQIADERYVAHPGKGSGHNRGLAIDCTVIELRSGKELDMGTGFDNFSDTAHQHFDKLRENVLLNRKLLRDLMSQYGYVPLETEWWHYYWPNNRDYEVLSLSHEEIARWKSQIQRLN